MTTPNLIVQPRELARSIRKYQRQNEQSLDDMAAARDREMAAAEQARLDANKQTDARLAEFLELEQGARAALKYKGVNAYVGADAAPSLMPIPDPVETLSECKSEIERILAGLANMTVGLKIMDIPSDVNQAELKRILQLGGEVPLQASFQLTCSLRQARERIPKLKDLGVRAEFKI